MAENEATSQVIEKAATLRGKTTLPPQHHTVKADRLTLRALMSDCTARTVQAVATELGWDLRRAGVGLYNMVLAGELRVAKQLPERAGSGRRVNLYAWAKPRRKPVVESADAIVSRALKHQPALACAWSRA